MAIITLARQVAAFGDEVGAELAKKLNYDFIKRTDIEKRIIELGFPEDKLPKYDERKPGFFASLVKDRDEYFNLTQYALLEAAQKNNVVIIGRGAFALFANVPNHISVRLVADEKSRLDRLEKEFGWSEKQARQRITKSDENRNGFHKNFYNIDVDNPINFDLVINTGKVSVENTADIIAKYAQTVFSAEKEKLCSEKVKLMLQAQTVVNKLIFEHKIKIEFLHASIEDNTIVLYGVSTSEAIVEQALRIIKNEMPGYNAVSSVSIVHNYKTY